jgi:hypothetical protein
VSIMPQDLESNNAPPSCTTLGCPEPATLVGTFTDHDLVFEGVAYCAYCAGYLYQQFEPTGPYESGR